MVKDWFDYNALTGELTRIKRYDSYGKLQNISKPVRGKNNRGYYWCAVFGKTCLVHRLIWLWMTGGHPDDEIDHINGDRLDNRWVNLRQVSAFENSRNQGVRKDCKSGVRGVTWSDRTNYRGRSKWVARISHKGVRYVLGYFDDFEDAVAARKQAEINFKYHPNHAKRKAYSYEN
jgi:hypothetical protein